jgi:hypothetical protein
LSRIRPRMRPRRPCELCGSLLPQSYNGHTCKPCRTMICEMCGLSFTTDSFKKPNRYCSRKCLAVFQTTLIGEKAKNWRGGIDSPNRAKRVKERYRLNCAKWRYLILKRDSYCCVKCGWKGLKRGRTGLHAHHVKPFALFPDFRTDIGNGVTLCSRCHKDVHKRNYWDESLNQYVQRAPREVNLDGLSDVARENNRIVAEVLRLAEPVPISVAQYKAFTMRKSKGVLGECMPIMIKGTPFLFPRGLLSTLKKKWPTAQTSLQG